jgi:hypothetical protein
VLAALHCSGGLFSLEDLQVLLYLHGGPVTLNPFDAQAEASPKPFAERKISDGVMVLRLTLRRR